MNEPKATSDEGDKSLYSIREFRAIVCNGDEISQPTLRVLVLNIESETPPHPARS